MERDFNTFFRKATGEGPYPFQSRFALTKDLPQLVNVPTGLGKTAMAVAGWLWRRHNGTLKGATPRRLVYCLPMRVLVEQTYENSVRWLKRLDLLGGTAEFEEKDDEGKLLRYSPDFTGLERVTVHVLMGGEDDRGWDIYPERDALLIGTQDMLLSRALNRGYAASRARWPMQFGLLHTDCLWVFDEIQLMGAGLATTAQLEAFRRLLGGEDGHRCRSAWMLATLRPDWLTTVDFRDRVDSLLRLDLHEDDHRNEKVKKRWQAKKEVKKADVPMGNASAVALKILKTHQPGTRTIVVVNTVRRACELFKQLGKQPADGTSKGKGKKAKKGGTHDATAVSDTPKPNLVLLHSRFRPTDRAKWVNEALSDPREGGTIVVNTQVIEAGVDVSAKTLFTELAPWSSLVQRFGRCNRKGEYEEARVIWIDLPNGKKEEREKAAKPYELEHLESARRFLGLCKNGVGPSALDEARGEHAKDFEMAMDFEHGHVIRRKDLIDLFDTTSDLAGNDIDIDRFVREVKDSDVRMFWRDWPQPKGYEPPVEKEPAPRREELCPAPVGEFRGFVKERKGKIWRWSFVEERWETADAGKIAPGQVFLVHASAGGYTPEMGWDGKSDSPVEPLPPTNHDATSPADSNSADPLSRADVWQTIAEHTDKVCQEIDSTLKALGLEDAANNALRLAARWHDRGKAHEVFQKALPGDPPRRGLLWAKAPGKWKRYARRHFRHELASALAVLLSPDDLIPATQRDLAAYLIGAHHGKVRLSIRSLPNEMRPAGDRRFARGLWDDDELPATDLGGGAPAPAVTLSLEPMELGLCESEPFTDQPSWAERMIRLRNALGPFHLAYLEAILRAADMRASKAADVREKKGDHDA